MIDKRHRTSELPVGSVSGFVSEMSVGIFTITSVHDVGEFDISEAEFSRLSYPELIIWVLCDDCSATFLA